ncbi:glycosyltransferase family 4 protein [Marixanthomonas spongiae]|uniref:glycosyltransferase family 4 protein n=1 Tax=Marixanthomonas spongiae TaxID=2174845 RepID=UPI001F0C1650|nr:glycosyltransferase family 4 protein [Marixanthomonas spongiae]
MNTKKLHITLFDGSFKTTPFINRLVKGLIAHGHRISIIGFNEHNPNPVPNVTYQALGSNASKLKLVLTSIQLALRSKNIGTIATTFKLIINGNREHLQQQNLRLALKKLNPDVVHLQWPSLLSWMEPYMPNDQFKVVLSQRGYHTNVRPFVDEGNFMYLQQWYPKLDGLHSVSKAISVVGKKIGQPHTQIDHVVYTGLPLDALAYKRKQSKGEPLQLLSVGRPHWKKDYPTALKACAELKNKNIDFMYTVVGGKDNEEVLFLINELGLQNNVTLIGKITQDQVYRKMQAADVLLLPSIEEGIANVAVEAMALGLPVISTDCGGMPELIDHQKDGWLVPTGNPHALADAAIHFKNLSLERVNNLTLAARRKVERQHTVEKMVSDMEVLYASTINP